MEKKKRGLKMNLQFFAEGKEPQEPATEPAAEPQNTDTEPSHKPTQDKSIPYERFKEVNDSLKAFKETFKELGLEDVGELKDIVSGYKKLEAERKKAEREQMSEIDRIKAERDEALSVKESYEKRIAEVEERIKDQAVKSEFIKVATANNIAYIDDAIKLADFSNIEYGEDGVKGVEEVVKSLVDGKPFLLKRETQEPKQIGAPSNPAKDSAAKTKEQLLDAARKKARSGRPEDIAEYSMLKRELGL